MSEDRDAKLRERTQELVRAINAGECDGERILAALRQTEEEAREEGKLACEGNAYPHWCRDGHDRIGFSGDNEMCPACLARAEGERAGREAERERAARIADVYSVHAIIDACPDYWVARQIASAIRYRGSE